MINRTQEFMSFLGKYKARRSLTDEEVAEKLDVSPEQWNAFLNAEKEIPEDIFVRLRSLANATTILVQDTVTLEGKLPKHMEEDESEENK